jgi:hypothetical protein
MESGPETGASVTKRGIVMTTSDRDRLLRLNGAAKAYQERYDSAYAAWGMRAPQPPLCQTPDDVDEYRRNQAAAIKKLLPFSEARADSKPGTSTFASLRRIKYWDLPADALEIFEPELIRAVKVASTRNDSIPAGDPPREIHERGPNGEHTIRFLGMRSFVEDFKAPIRKVTSFTTDQGRWKPNGGWF